MTIYVPIPIKIFIIWCGRAWAKYKQNAIQVPGNSFQNMTRCLFSLARLQSCSGNFPIEGRLQLPGFSKILWTNSWKYNLEQGNAKFEFRKRVSTWPRATSSACSPLNKFYKLWTEGVCGLEVHVFQCRCPMSQLIKFRGNLKSIQHNLHLLRYQNHLDHDGEVVLIEEGKKMSCEMASERSSMKLAHQIRKRLPREKIFCTKSQILLGAVHILRNTNLGSQETPPLPLVIL